MTDNKGKKFDNGKLRFELIPPEAEEALADILTSGAIKYGDRNWEKGIDHEKIIGALRRHLNEWIKGVRLDRETGKSHLDHVLTNAAILVTYERRSLIQIKEKNREAR